MKKLLLTLTFLAFSLPAVAGEKESSFDRIVRTNTIRCGYISWPPGFEVDPNTKELKGPTKELFESILKLTGWNVEFVETALGNVPLDLQNRKFDAMCADGPWVITNIKLVDYTTPVAYTPVLAYVRANEKRLKSYEDLNNPAITLAGIDGDTSTDLATIRFPKAKLRTLINLTDPAQMLLEVADGKADAVILDPVTADNFIKNNPGKIKSLLGSGPLAVYPVGFSVRWGEDQLKQVLNRAIDMAINTGLNDQKLDLYDPARKTIYSPMPYYQTKGPKK